MPAVTLPLSEGALVSKGNLRKRCGTTAHGTSSWSSAWRTAPTLKSTLKTSRWCSGECPAAPQALVTSAQWHGPEPRVVRGKAQWGSRMDPPGDGQRRPTPSPELTCLCFGSCKNADGVELYNEINLYARVNSKVRSCSAGHGWAMHIEPISSRPPKGLGTYDNLGRVLGVQGEVICLHTGQGHPDLSHHVMSLLGQEHDPRHSPSPACSELGVLVGTQ